MQKNYKQIQKELFSAEFRKFFKKELSLNMEKLESNRKFCLSIITCLILIAIIFPIIIFIVIEKNYFTAELIETIVSIEIIFSIICTFIIKHYKNKAKTVILPRLLSYIGDFEVCPKDSYYEREYISNLELIGSFNKYSCDDRIKGIYNGIKIDISEILLQRETGSGKNRRVVTVFDGLFIKVPSLKKYKGNTVIKKNSFNTGFNSKKVNLEDPEFESYYDVYSTDQIEARYLITAAFMNRMVSLAKKGIGQNITLSFEEGNVNICVSSSKDWFEIPILQPAGNIHNYRAILLELVTIFSIIDSLKLDQNIGM